jgi:TonB family protein
MKHLNALLLAMMAVSGSLTAQDPLSVAKDLYASAAYEDALSALARIKDAGPDLAQQVDQYRAFSLFALGRTAEAESVFETVIRRDPMVKPSSQDASPRIAALFAQVRNRLLPDLVRDGYRAARETMEKGDLAGAVPQLQQVKSLLAELKAAGASNDALADMDVLVDGFLDLARNSERVTAEAAAAAKKEAAAAKTEAAAAKTEAAAAAPPPAAPASAAPVANAAGAPSIVNQTPIVYSANDTDVVAPVTLRQQMPTIPYSLARSMTNSTGAGVLEVTIDERGRVEQAIMREPVNSFFDSVVIAAARSWQFKPAMKGGEPVKYLKRIGVSVASLAK